MVPARDITAMTVSLCFADENVPGPMWFVAGNHEDHELLADRYGLPGSTDDDFPADHYGRLRCVVNGHVVGLPGGPRVGGLWGIDDEAPALRMQPPRAGEHTDAILIALGYSTERIAELRQAGAIS